ncbi:MAG: hypothetical protein Q9227_005436 [Pyrenula ochraceoflavens]
MPTLKNRSGCQHCRLRHVKCDQQEPACFQCIKSGIECVGRYSTKFRHSTDVGVSGIGKVRCDYHFAENQPWCKTPRTLNFVDETGELSTFYDQPFPDEAQNSPSTSSAFASHGSSATSVPAQTPASPLDPNVSDTYISPSIGQKPPFDPASCSPTGPSLLGLNPHTPKDVIRTISGCGTEDFASIYLESPIWPLHDKQEAYLMRYFVEKLAPWFDLCDNAKHFAQVVPQRAAVCLPLLYAIFAVSAKELSRTAVFDEKVSDQYHQMCLEYMIPAMNDTATIMDENMLAATVILRYLEELEIPLAGKESQYHLFGTHVFISAQERTAKSGGLRLAAYWVGLRQEVYVALLGARPIMPQLEYCNIDRSFEPADEGTWANRIIVHCAEVLRYCFGDEAQSVAVYENLVEYCEGWEASKPPSLTPVYFKPAEQGLIFPELWYLNDAAVTGCQHLHLAKLLLAAHNPKIPRLGPKQRIAMQETDELIKNEVKIVCAMAESNPRTAPNYVTACTAIAMGGDRFTDKKEQEALFAILLKAEQKMAWPTLKA